MTIRNQLLSKRATFSECNEPLISFPIATYNRPRILADRTLPSILSQDYSNLEVIIVGDCMKDSDYQIVSKLASRKVKVFNLSRRTHYPSDPFSAWCVIGSRPRNIAARICKGDWHWWISDDDVIAENALSSVVDFICKNRIVESIYGNRRFTEQGVIPKVFSLANNPAPLPFPFTGMPAWINRNYLSRIFPWSMNSYLNPYNKPCDYDMQVRMHNYGVRFGYLNSVLVDQFPDGKLNAIGSKLYMSNPDLLL